LSGNSQGARKSSSAAVISEGLLLHDLGGLRLEVAPEFVEHRLPVHPPAGNVVELVLEMGGEIVGDVALEEALEEGGQKPPALLGNEAVLLEADIAAVLQRLEGRRVGRRPADAQLLHLLDQARFGVTRRRLGEMLLGDDLLLRRHVAFAQPRQRRDSSSSASSRPSS
jgi:hypothetical protein